MDSSQVMMGFLSGAAVAGIVAYVRLGGPLAACRAQIDECERQRQGLEAEATQLRTVLSKASSYRYDIGAKQAVLEELRSRLPRTRRRSTHE